MPLFEKDAPNYDEDEELEPLKDEEVVDDVH